MRYIWLPFDWLEIGDLFEPMAVLYGYTPICRKVSVTQGIGTTHMGVKTYGIATDEYVRICTAWYLPTVLVQE